MIKFFVKQNRYKINELAWYFKKDDKNILFAKPIS
jgi:hypothetical protein